MKRVLVVLALSLMLLFSFWGEALADEPGGSILGGDHPWTGEDFGEDGRNRYASEGGELVGCVLLPINIILIDYTYIDGLRSILWGTDRTKTVTSPTGSSVTVIAAPNIRVR